MSEDYSNEIWRPVVGYEGLYEVSNLGRVRSLDVRVRCANNATRVKKGVVLTLHSDDTGRMGISLWRNNKGKTFRVHTLVLNAFIGPCPEGMQCCHWDGNASSNKLENLRWDTQVENEKDKDRHGTRTVGEKDVHAKLKDWQAQEIIDTTGTTSVSEMANKFGISKQVVCCIRSGRTWKHLPRPVDIRQRRKKYDYIKLTPELAKEIMRLKGVLSGSKIAKMFGVSPMAVSSIHTGRSWSRFTGDLSKCRDKSSTTTLLESDVL